MSATPLTLFIADTAAMEGLGARLAACTPSGTVIFLHGQLGAGKTTLVRGFLHSLGHMGPVRSPTYTLVEPYDVNQQRIYHFDLYRLGDPEELEYLGIRDYFDDKDLSLVEWPEQGAGFLPQADLELNINYQDEGRDVRIFPKTEQGRAILGLLGQEVGQAKT